MWQALGVAAQAIPALRSPLGKAFQPASSADLELWPPSLFQPAPSLGTASSLCPGIICKTRAHREHVESTARCLLHAKQACSSMPRVPLPPRIPVTTEEGHYSPLRASPASAGMDGAPGRIPAVGPVEALTRPLWLCGVPRGPVTITPLEGKETEARGGQEFPYPTR